MTLLIAAIVAAVVAWLVCRYLCGDAPTPSSGKVNYATVYVSPTGEAAAPFIVKVAPERLNVRVGEFVDWTVVDLSRTKPSMSVRFSQGEPLELPTGEFTTSVRRKVRLPASPTEQRKVASTRGEPSPLVFPYQVFINGNPGVDPEIAIEY